MWIAAVVVLLALAIVVVRIYQDRPQPQRWALSHPIQKPVRPVSPSSTKFEITINTDQCNPPASPLDHIEVDESTETVEVTAFIEPPGSPLAPQWSASDCLTFVRDQVELAEPLGDRELVVGGFEGSDPMRESP